MLNYIIDGFNLGFKIPRVAQALRSGDVEEAIREIITFAGRNVPLSARKIILVFDGQRGTYSYIATPPNMRLTFSRAPETADDLIRKHLRGLSSAGEWTVVTSDREIISTAKAAGASVIRSEDFAAKATQPAAPSSFDRADEKYNPRNVDIDFWLKQFGAEDNE